MNLQMNEIRLIQGLACFSSLVALNLSANHLVSLQGIEHAPSLTSLDVSSNFIADGVQYVAKLKRLEWLNLSMNRVVRLGWPAGSLPFLRFLDVSENLLCELSEYTVLGHAAPNLEQLVVTAPDKLPDLLSSRSREITSRVTRTCPLLRSVDGVALKYDAIAGNVMGSGLVPRLHPPEIQNDQSTAPVQSSMLPRKKRVSRGTMVFRDVTSRASETMTDDIIHASTNTDPQPTVSVSTQAEMPSERLERLAKENTRLSGHAEMLAIQLAAMERAKDAVTAQLLEKASELDRIQNQYHAQEQMLHAATSKIDELQTAFEKQISLETQRAEAHCRDLLAKLFKERERTNFHQKMWRRQIAQMSASLERAESASLLVHDQLNHRDSEVYRLRRELDATGEALRHTRSARDAAYSESVKWVGDSLERSSDLAVVEKSSTFADAVYALLNNHCVAHPTSCNAQTETTRFTYDVSIQVQSQCQSTSTMTEQLVANASSQAEEREPSAETQALSTALALKESALADLEIDAREKIADLRHRICQHQKTAAEMKALLFETIEVNEKLESDLDAARVDHSETLSLVQGLSRALYAKHCNLETATHQRLAALASAASQEAANHDLRQTLTALIQQLESKQQALLQLKSHIKDLA